MTEAQIIAILKEQELGQKVADLCRKLGISDQTFYNWKSKHGGMDVDELRRLKDMEQENARLKKCGQSGFGDRHYQSFAQKVLTPEQKQEAGEYVEKEGFQRHRS